MIILALAVLGVVVFFHELGHFVVAKKVGIKVYTFSIGFGPKLWGFTRNDTDYRISAIPFGGYVAMAGEEVADRKGEADEFASKTPFQRFCVAFAGPFMNFVLAAVLIWIVMLVGEKEPAYLSDMVVGFVQKDSVAMTAGFQTGDKIIALNGKKATDWDHFLKNIMLSRNTITITYQRNGQTFDTTMQLKRNNMTGAVDLGLTPGFNPIIGEVQKDTPAAKFGLKPGDIITAINDKQITCWDEILIYLDTTTLVNDTAIVTVDRNGEKMAFELKELKKENGRYMLGISLKLEEKLVRYSFLKSFPAAAVRYWGMMKDMYTALELLFSRNISFKTMAGPIGIVQMTSAVAKFGIISLFTFIAFISINLAIVNLLPIPITDGGQIVFVLIEKITGKPLSKKFLNAAMNVGFAMLIALAIFVTYNDFVRIFKGALGG